MTDEYEQDIPFGEGSEDPDADVRPRSEMRCRVPVAALQAIADPVSTPPWDRTRPSWDADEVRRRASARDYDPCGHVPWFMNPHRRGAKDEGPVHMARVAWLMNNEHAPEVTIGAAETITDYGDWPILDGNHRPDIASDWLLGADYGEEPDHDGSNEKGWRCFRDTWGRIDGMGSAAFLAVEPFWVEYGK